MDSFLFGLGIYLIPGQAQGHPGVDLRTRRNKLMGQPLKGGPPSGVSFRVA